MTTTDIKNLIERNYKDTSVKRLSIYGDLVLTECETNSNKYPFIALRILNKYPNIRAIHFTGGWLEHYYTRETLKWGNYKVKEHKN